MPSILSTFIICIRCLPTTQTFLSMSSRCIQVLAFLSSSKATQLSYSIDGRSSPGRALGPALFSTAINSVLWQVQERYPSIQILAYLDDMFLIGLERDTLSALALLQPAFSEIGFQISPSKCEIYSPSGSVTLSDSCLGALPVRHDGTMILGVPLGHIQYFSDSCQHTAHEGNQLCDKLKDLDDTQSAFLLLRYCHVPRMKHLARSVSPESVRKPMTHYPDKRSVTCWDMRISQIMPGFRPPFQSGWEDLV